ncbi:hypothetical protein MMC28_011660 [Mycoblastus sanguinarius]|nr:hypothetical protein [Mycoblastus sanguinarius]
MLKPILSCALFIYSFSTKAQSNTTNTNTTTPATPPCLSPTGFANTVVFTPDPLATVGHEIADSFVNAHYIYYTDIPNIALSQASIASFCLDQCVAYQANATGNAPCLSFSVDMGRQYPPVANDTEIRWYCTAFDAPLTADLYGALEAGVESYMHVVGVNRMCEGMFRAY